MQGFRHLRSRMRESRGLEPFPAETPFKRYLDYFMYAVGVLAPLALVPQITQIYSAKSSAGVSLLTWLLLMVVNVLWITYAVVHNDRHIIVANGLTLIFNAVIVVGIFLY